MNIFHELAEKAFNGYYTTKHWVLVGDSLSDEEWDFWVTWAAEYSLPGHDFYADFNREEQALGLLFVGEMYAEQ